MRRGERVHLRATPEELEAWRAAAAEEGLTLSDWIRRAAHERLSDSAAPTDLADWRAAAAEEGLTLSEWLQRAAREWVARACAVACLVLCASCMSAEEPRELGGLDGSVAELGVTDQSLEDLAIDDAATGCRPVCVAPEVCTRLEIEIDGGTIYVGDACRAPDGGPS